MVDFYSCISDKEAKGLITSDQKKKIKDKYDKLKTETASNNALYGNVYLKQRLDRIDESLKQAKRRKLLATYKRVEIWKELQKIKGVDKAEAMARLNAIHSYDPNYRFEIMPFDIRKLELLGEIQASKAMPTQLRQEVFELARKQNLTSEDIMMEMLNPGTSKYPVLTKFVQQYKDINSYLIKRYKTAGGEITEMPNYIPHSHDKDSMLAVGKDTWIDDVTKWIDRSQMFDRETGAPLNDVELRELLDWMFDNITTDGLRGMNPVDVGPKGISKSPATKYSEERKLIFDDQFWGAYNDKYSKRKGGNGTVHSMWDNIQRLAEDVSLIEHYGPNPDNLRGFMDKAYKKITGRNNPDETKTFNFAFDEAMGKSEFHAYAGQGARRTAATFSAFRALARGRLLGMAALQDIFGPFLPQLSQAIINKDGSGFARFAGTYINNIRKMNYGREDLENIGFLMHQEVESWKEVLREAATSENALDKLGRWMVNGINVSAKAVDDITLTTRLGNSARNANARAVNVTWSKLIRDDVSWDDLGEAMQGYLKTAQIDQAEWDIIRSAPLSNIGGGRTSLVNTLEMGEWLKQNGHVFGDKIMIRFKQAMILSGQGLVSNTTVTGGLLRRVQRGERGTVVGELSRNVWQFTRYPMEFWRSFVAPHLKRVYRGENRAESSVILASMMMGMMLFGSIGNALYSLARGEVPDPSDSSFWMKGLSMGIMGSAFTTVGINIVFGSATDPDTSAEGIFKRLGKAALGASLGQPIITGMRLVNNVRQEVSGEDGDWARSVKDVSQLIPGQNVYWTRAFWDRYVVSGMMELVDPEGYSEIKKRAQKWDRENDVEYWLPKYE